MYGSNRCQRGEISFFFGTAAYLNFFFGWLGTVTGLKAAIKRRLAKVAEAVHTKVLRSQK